MEFEELQAIWADQDEEALFTIDRSALYAQIKEKSQSVSHKLNVYERLMFLGNLIIGLILFFDVYREAGETYEYLLPALYLLFSLGTVILRRVRKQEEVQFELTMMGELNKAIWQNDLLISRGRSMMVWYMLPLMLVLAITLYLNDNLIWALGTIFVVIPVAYFSGRWEINKWYLPKKRELEALREKLRSVD